MAQFKCGSKGLADIDRKTNGKSEIPINYMYGYDLIAALKAQDYKVVNPAISAVTGKYLTKLLKEENTKPFFLFVRDVDAMYRSQIIQSFRTLCRNSNIFVEDITLAGNDYYKKDSLFKLISEVYPNFKTKVFSDIHYTRYTFDEALLALQYIELTRKDIFDNLFILDLDNYSKTEQSLKLLHEFKVIDYTYFKEKSWNHSTKTLYVPEIFSAVKLEGINRVPYIKNKTALELIRSLYSDKFYSYERLVEYTNAPI